MTRPVNVRFGSFGRVLGTAVYANGWWLAPAADVELGAGGPSWHALTDHMTACATAAVRPAPERVDAAWVLQALPVGLQLSPSEVRRTQFPMGFMASRVEEDPVADGRIDVAYPFLLNERAGRVLLGFGISGPPASIRDTIIVAFGLRLLGSSAG
jgi:hypothetical protein